ncbi:MAG: PIG-L family deacetylase [Fimbriimonadales bacterium]|nr:PIG-L family deacetylase [Fimbriimonadales bacterium]
MRAFDEDPSLRWLFVFAHPDDELGVCAWIRRLTRAGATVHACWTHHTPVRKAEAVRAMAALGVEERNLAFLPGVDGRVAEQMPELWPRMRQVVDEARPDRVVTIAFEQGHLDHDATNLLVNRSFEGPVLEYPMYHPYTRRIQTLNRFATPDGEEVLELTQEECALKRRLARGYPSQNIHAVLVWYHVYRWLTLRPLSLCRSERLRLQVHRDYRSPNLPPRLRREVERSATWRRWLLAAEAFLSLTESGW